MSSLSLRELKQHLAIDRYNLDSDCCMQPTLFEEAAELCAELKIAARVAKHNVEVIKSKRSLDIRKKLVDDGQKPTEATITAMVNCDREKLEACEKQYAAERAALRAEGVMDAFDQRRSMLNNVTEMIKAGFTKLGGFIPNAREQETIERGIANVRSKKRKGHQKRDRGEEDG